VVPGEQRRRIGRRENRVLLSLLAGCYRHGGHDAIEPHRMSKPARSFPRPLSDFASAALSDVLKSQGFASAEILSRWSDIVGPEVAAYSEPLKINWSRVKDETDPEPATLVLRVEGPA